MVNSIKHTPSSGVDAMADFIPNPIESPAIHDTNEAHKMRRLHCENYNICLDIAAEKGWAGFSCEHCGAYRLMGKESLSRDMRGICELMESLAELSEEQNEAFVF
jgi:hypothetical protein